MTNNIQRWSPPVSDRQLVEHLHRTSVMLMSPGDTHHIERLRNLLTQAEEDLLPADPVVVESCIDFVVETLNIKTPFRSDAVKGVYVKLIGEYPTDIVRAATKKLLMTYKWPKMPTIADWTIICEELASPRRSWLIMIRVALSKLEMVERYK